MLRNYFKVVEDFEASAFIDGSLKLNGELVAVEKGDIIVDVKPHNDDLFIGKTLVSQKVLQIPKGCIEELKDDGDDAEMPSEKQQRKSQEVKEMGIRKTSILKENCKRESQDLEKNIRPKNVPKAAERPVNEKRSSCEKESEIPDEYVPISPHIEMVPQPSAPPRARRNREVSTPNEKFRSRESDEGYNSCSHYSGDKPPDNEPIVTRRSYCNTQIGDVPLLSSFRESPQRSTNPRPSIQDEDGYEIPTFTPRVSILDDELASSAEKGVTLKLIYQRKSTSFEEKPNESMSKDTVKYPLDSIGENSESIYETWATDPKQSNPSKDRRKILKERALVVFYFVISLLLSLGLFLVLLYISKADPLLCFATSVNIFAILFIGLLTMAKRRWLCIATLLAPSLFSRRVKIGLCITLCILIIAGPVCNVASNLQMVLNCKGLASNVSDSASLQHDIVANKYESRDAISPTDPNTGATLKPTNANSSSLPRVENRHFRHCKSALRIALKNTLPTCSSKDKSCVLEIVEPHFGDLCRNFTKAKTKCSPAKQTWELKENKQEEILSFRKVILQLLPLLLLLLLQEAYWYNRDYLSNKEMDNVYITGKLKALDCERKERGMRNKLFPLRKLEFRTHVLPSSFLQTSQEIREVLKWVVVWISLGLAVLLAIFLDKIVYEAVVFLNENASNQCSNQFKALNKDMVYSICILLALLIVAILVQSYALRSRSRICSFFYPKKESARGVYLYYKILHDRAHFWKACKERGRMLSECRRTRWKIGIGHRLFRSLPTPLRKLLERLFIYRCMICNSLTARKTFVCSDEDCFATFCYECFIDMGQSCISCRPSGARDSVFTSV